MAGKVDIFSASWCDLVFTGRNREYGAYILRKKYSKNIFLAVIFAILLIALSIGVPLIVELIKSKTGDEEKIKITEVTTLEAPPPIDKDQPPPPPVEPPPPLKSTVKFTPPVVVKDEQVTDTIRTQEELKEVDAGTKTQEGDSLNGKDQSLEEQTIGDDPTVYNTYAVEVQPGFPGGDDALYKYLGDNIHYPPIAKDNGISGTVYLSFVIDREGKVTDVKVLRGPGAGLDEEAMRVVKSMPAWKPGKQNGKPVKVQCQIPVRFLLKN